MKVILEEYLQAIAATGERIARCEEAMRELLEKWRLAPVVRAVMAAKGFQTVAAMILVSELGRWIALLIHARLWRIWAWYRLKILRVTNGVRVASPSAAMHTLAGCW